jgi:hypothetical protein
VAGSGTSLNRNHSSLPKFFPFSEANIISHQEEKSQKEREPSPSQHIKWYYRKGMMLTKCSQNWLKRGGGEKGIIRQQWLKSKSFKLSLAIPKHN